jgi:hypothetical protein
MFLTLYSSPRGGHPPVSREIIQSGQTHVLWRGEPDETYLYGLKVAERFAAQAGNVSCTVVRRQDTGVELSFGAWWPRQLRRLDESLARGWPLTHTIHTFPDGCTMSIMYAPRHGQAVMTFQIPGHATETADLTMREVADGTIEWMVEQRGWQVIR